MTALRYLSKVRLMLWWVPRPAFSEAYQLTNTLLAHSPSWDSALPASCLLPRGSAHSPAPTCLCCLWSPALPAFLLWVHSGWNLTPTPVIMENVFVASPLCGGCREPWAQDSPPPPLFLLLLLTKPRETGCGDEPIR